MIGNSMYNSEMANYPLPYRQDNADTADFVHWGHFSQIVWKATQEVGCFTQYCPDGLKDPKSGQSESTIAPYFTVCNYRPAGNVQDEYSQVGAPLGQPIVVVTPS
ncbi:hypothetical protein H2200_011039 [Cladophialophora chaetospira]|uniref:SCP domain-containing protein n=1 Tax=Cladophialophora chaetospira TaxID=386627 RepID=A0AA39CDD8_9EURO|nr:hypothetical protein H2200_011039 [Cladophialophora chaetospira]